MRQTPQERALYAALTHEDRKVEGMQEPSELKAARESASGLLKLCSHFSQSGAVNVLTAEDECHRQMALRQEHCTAAERDLASVVERAMQTAQLVQHFEPHFCSTPNRSFYKFLREEPKAKVVARAKYLGVEGVTGKTSREVVISRLFEALAGTSEGVKEMVLRVDFEAESAPPVDSLTSTSSWLQFQRLLDAPKEHPESEMSQVVQRLLQALPAEVDSGPPARCVRLRFNLGMPACPETKVGKKTAVHGDWEKFEKDNWAWLADPVQAASLRKVLEMWKAELERYSLRICVLQGDVAAKRKELCSFKETLHASQLQAEAEEAVEMLDERTPAFAKYGSKIEMLVKHVMKLRSEDSSSKIICFVQWEDLNLKISQALREFGVEHLTLRGSVWSRRDVLTKFQYESDCPKLLLLSLEGSASGTNLTAANHVIIAHPMEAATSEEAVAFEMQAIGRVRRPGQLRRIHIWRFVTMDTIEQAITEQHQRELWERQRTTVVVPDVDPNSSLACESDEEAETLQADLEGTQCYNPTPINETPEKLSKHPQVDLIDISSTQSYVPTSLQRMPEDKTLWDCESETVPFCEDMTQRYEY